VPHLGGHFHLCSCLCKRHERLAAHWLVGFAGRVGQPGSLYLPVWLAMLSKMPRSERSGCSQGPEGLMLRRDRLRL
jgi:hypothetical protein